MKVKRKVLIISLLCLFILLISLSSVMLFGNIFVKEQKVVESNTMLIRGEVIKKITDKIYIEKLDEVKHNIVLTEKNDFAENDDFESYITDYLETQKYIIKYSVDDEFLAYHYNKITPLTTDTQYLYAKVLNNGTEYAVIKDAFVIYNVFSQQKLEFDNQDDFIDYCNKNSLNLFDWKFVADADYRESVQLTDNLELCSTSHTIGVDQLIFKNKVLLEGYISDYKVDNGTVTFRLRIPNCGLEFPLDSNSSLAKSSSSIGKCYIGFSFIFPCFEDVYFDEYISIDTQGNYSVVHS